MTHISTRTRKEKQYTDIFSRESSVYKRLQTIISDDTETAVIAFRVPKKYKILYDLLRRSEKREFKDLWIQVLEQYYFGKTSESKNINIVVNIVKAEAKAGSMDPEILNEKIKILESENKELKDILRYYKGKISKLEEENTMLLKVKKKYYELKQQLPLWLTWLRKGHIQYVVKEIEKVVKYGG